MPDARAGVMAMTMVDFNKLQLKRSIHPVTDDLAADAGGR
jgi:hypothetical protein